MIRQRQATNRRGRPNDDAVLTDVEDLVSVHFEADELHHRRTRWAMIKVGAAITILLLCMGTLYSYKGGSFPCGGLAHLRPSPTTNKDASLLPTGVVDTELVPRWTMAAYYDTSCNNQHSYSLMASVVKSCDTLPATPSSASYKRVDWTPSGFKLCLYSRADCSASRLVAEISGHVTCDNQGQGAKAWKVVTSNQNC